MKLHAEFSSNSSERLCLTDSDIASVPFQLLPRATYPVAQLERSLVWQSQFVADLEQQPLISIVLSDASEVAELSDWSRAFQSIAVQAYRAVEVLIAVPNEYSYLRGLETLFERYGLAGRILAYASEEQAPSSVLGETRGESVLVLDCSALLHPHALLIIAKEIKARPADIYYANEAVMAADDSPAHYLRRAPLEKYDVLSYDQIGSFFALSASAAKECVGQEVLGNLLAAYWSWQISAWAISCKRTFGFVPLGLVARRRKDRAGDLASAEQAVKALVLDYAEKLECKLESLELVEEEGCLHTHPVFAAERASVQVVVPFHDKAGLTIQCLKSLAVQDCLEDLKITLVDNNSEAQERKTIDRAIEELGLVERAKVIEDAGYFNYARLNNIATKEAETEYVLFLNNDVELSSTHAVSTLVDWASLPGVEAVGGQLCYEDGRVQHGGINFSSIRPENVTGVDQFSFVAREVNAVSYAMALVRRSAYLRMGMLDEQVCPNGFGDALFFHHLKRSGGRIVYTPYASGIHRESASRGRMPEELELYEMHCAQLPIAALYDDMQASAQPTRLPLAEIEEVPLDALLSRVRRVRWLYNFGNSVARNIIRFWPRR